jgi:hypothetical protein
MFFLLSKKLISLLFDGTLKQIFQITAMEHFNKCHMKINIYARFRNLNKLKLISQNVNGYDVGRKSFLLFVDPSRNVFLLQAAPFTVRSTPDFRNTNGMEQKTVT